MVSKALLPFAKKVGLFGAAGAVLLSPLLIRKCHDWNRVRKMRRAFENGSCPEPIVRNANVIERPDIASKLRTILDSSTGYWVIHGEGGTGKTTAIRTAAQERLPGLIYFDAMSDSNSTVREWAEAFSYQRHPWATGEDSDLLINSKHTSYL